MAAIVVGGLIVNLTGHLRAGDLYLVCKQIVTTTDALP